MAETPQEVEINVVMGTQLRAIVRSALLHVKNKYAKLKPDTVEDYLALPMQIEEIIDAELAAWPMSTTDEEDHLPAFLEERFTKEGTEYSEGYWEFQAASVRRAVGKGRLRPYEKPESERVRQLAMQGMGQIRGRHQDVAELLQKYKEAGQPVVSVEQVFHILTGAANADQYESALQVLPTGVDK